LLYVAWVFLHGNRDRLLASAAAVTAFVAFNKVLSPQYVSWLVMLVPGWESSLRAWLVAVLVLTRLEWDRFASPHGSTHHGASAVVVDLRPQSRAGWSLRAARGQAPGGSQIAKRPLTILR